MEEPGPETAGRRIHLCGRMQASKGGERVSRQLAVLVLASVFVGLAVPFGSMAAPPTKGGLYVGKLTTALGTEKRLSLNIANDGKTAVAVLSCSNVRVGLIRDVAITGSKFKGAKRVGSLTVWSITGTFASSTKAIAKLSLNAVCDGRGGTVVLARTKP
jgi:hypothetical protein